MRAMQLGDSLEEFLVQATQDSKLRQVMMSLSEAIRTIAFKVRHRALVPAERPLPLLCVIAHFFFSWRQRNVMVIVMIFEGTGCPACKMWPGKQR